MQVKIVLSSKYVAKVMGLSDGLKQSNAFIKSPLTITFDIKTKGSTKELLKSLKQQFPKNTKIVYDIAGNSSAINNKTSQKKRGKDCITCKSGYVFSNVSDRCIKADGKSARKLGLYRPSSLKKKTGDKSQKKVRFARTKKEVVKIPKAQTSPTQIQPPVVPQVKQVKESLLSSPILSFIKPQEPKTNAPVVKQAVMNSKTTCVNTNVSGKQFVFQGFRDPQLQAAIESCGSKVIPKLVNDKAYVLYFDKDDFKTSEAFKDANKLGSLGRAFPVQKFIEKYNIKSQPIQIRKLPSAQ